MTQVSENQSYKSYKSDQNDQSDQVTKVTKVTAHDFMTYIMKLANFLQTDWVSEWVSDWHGHFMIGKNCNLCFKALYNQLIPVHT